jgi:MFS transporter, DHA3 family, tetracycline resistance protein
MLVDTRRFNAYSVYLTLSFAYGLASMTIFTTNLFYQLEVAKLNPLQLVLVGTVLEGSCFICQVPTGVLADLYSRRLSIIVGIVLVGLGFLLEGAIPQFWAIAGGMVFYGVGATFVSGAEEAWVADELGEERAARAFLRGAQLSQVGNILGALLGVTLASFWLPLPVLIGGGMLVLLGLLLAVVMPEHGFRPAPKAERQSWQGFVNTFKQGFRLAWASPMLLLILSVSLFYGLSSEGYDRLWLAHLQDNIHLPALWNFQPVVWLAVITIISEALSIGATELVQRYIKMDKQRTLVRVLAVLNVLGMLALLLLALAGNFVLAIVAIWIVETFRNVKAPIYTTWLMQNTPSGARATLISLDGQMDAIGQIAGGPPVGYLGTIFSLRVALAAVSVILAPILLFYAAALRRLRAQPVAAIASDEEIVTPVL